MCVAFSVKILQKLSYNEETPVLQFARNRVALHELRTRFTDYCMCNVFTMGRMQ